ncbi:hypothetical protein Cob_v000076 [Colletotrichum orbiculare MAFF 240422]|uniref:Uncharacterized protein n=1 Tax=Colletotrichum orbiculare (strain 104-T / ATCC 96160 / CBS 514.97 / LARS 414 / MAFF 240422) TaxID=1213857 RepID=A0A484G9F1_COLOR|nr:hypothetical protein Cob_v000076 [Colletotrichum orbiculare MAFF 240422]
MQPHPMQAKPPPVLRPRRCQWGVGGIGREQELENRQSVFARSVVQHLTQHDNLAHRTNLLAQRNNLT